MKQKTHIKNEVLNGIKKDSQNLEFKTVKI